VTRRRGSRALALVPPVQHVIDPTLVAQLDVLSRVRDERDEAVIRCQELTAERDDWVRVAVAWAPLHGAAYCLNGRDRGSCALPPSHNGDCVYFGTQS
jgi:hypothetical protein